MARWADVPRCRPPRNANQASPPMRRTAAIRINHKASLTNSPRLGHPAVEGRARKSVAHAPAIGSGTRAARRTRATAGRPLGDRPGLLADTPLPSPLRPITIRVGAGNPVSNESGLGPEGVIHDDDAWGDRCLPTSRSDCRTSRGRSGPVGLGGVRVDHVPALGGQCALDRVARATSGLATPSPTEGAVQLLAGMWEFRNRNVFGATAFAHLRRLLDRPRPLSPSWSPPMPPAPRRWPTTRDGSCSPS